MGDRLNGLVKDTLPSIVVVVVVVVIVVIGHSSFFRGYKG